MLRSVSAAALLLALAGTAQAQFLDVYTELDFDDGIRAGNAINGPIELVIRNDLDVAVIRPAEYDITITTGTSNLGMSGFSGTSLLRLNIASGGTVRLTGANTHTGPIVAEGQGELLVQANDTLGGNSMPFVELNDSVRMYFGAGGAPLTSGSAFFALNDAVALAYTAGTDAGTSTIVLQGTMNVLQFSGGASAANAAVVNQGGQGSGVYFYGSSTAGDAVIGNLNGFVSFRGTSTAGNAKITNSPGSGLFFGQDSSAGSAEVYNSGTVTFTGQSSAGNAHFVNYAGARIDFNSFSTGHLASIDNRSGGIVDISSRTTSEVQLGGLTGNGQVNMGANTLSLGLNNANSLFAGVLNGAGGSLIKLGTGQLTLDGINTYTGTTQVLGGTLNVTGDVVSDVFVGAGARLTGAGQIGSTTIGTSGIFYAGPETSAPNFASDLRFHPGSYFQFATDDMIATAPRVHGDAYLDGNFEHYAGVGGYAEGDRFRIMSVNGVIDGTFATASTDLAYLDVELIYEPNAVWMELARTALRFPDLAGLTANDRSVASAVEALGAGNPIFDAIVTSTEEQARQGFGMLNGEVHASTRSGLAATGLALADVVNGRLRQLSPPAPALGYADNIAGSVDNTAWAQVFGSLAHFADTGAARAIGGVAGGFVAGADTRLGDDLTVGLAGGATSGTLRQVGGAGIVNITGGHLAAYGAWDNGVMAARFGGSYGYIGLDSTRNVAVGALAETLTASYGGRVALGFGELGYRLAVGNAIVEPYGGLALVSTSVDGFTETGGASALSVAAQHDLSAFATLGLRGEWTLAATDGAVTSLTAGLAWRHRIGDDGAAAGMAFASGGPGFAISGHSLPRDALMLEAGINHERTSGMTISASYSGDVSRTGQSHSLKAGLSQRF